MYVKIFQNLQQTSLKMVPYEVETHSKAVGYGLIKPNARLWTHKYDEHMSKVCVKYVAADFSPMEQKLFIFYMCMAHPI